MVLLSDANFCYNYWIYHTLIQWIFLNSKR